MTNKIKNDTPNLTIETLRLIIYVGSLIAATFVFYGSLDKRVTINETKLEHKVDGEQLQIQLKQWKDEIINEIKDLKK